MRDDYAKFIERKAQCGSTHGFDPVWMPEFLFPFQRHLVEWSIRKGRSAIFADCGLGKSPMQLVWAENVVRKTNGRVLILAPLAVSHQIVREGEKFGIECSRSTDGTPSGRITITNYERADRFSSDDYDGIVCDESSILKNFNGATRRIITELARKIRYRLLCTATAAPNDYVELGTSSEALGELGNQDMITRFFKEDVIKDYLGWGRKKYRFRGHSESQFWRWVCSWARVCRKPSDIGFDDEGFRLPELIESEHVIESSTARDGMLFSLPAVDLREQREERRITMIERCQAAASHVMSCNGPSVVWCHLNDEGDALVDMIDDSVQVSGSMSDEEKEERLVGFQRGQIKRLVTKPKIGCFGLNWQHCSNIVTFPSHSWEQYYQSVRRCWRFGQKNPVRVTVVTTQGEIGVLRNLQSKAMQADRMFEELTRHANDSLRIESKNEHTKKENRPTWLASTSA